jgi:hypothetical protein
VEFRILGPLEVLDDDGRPLALGGAKQRTLLAVLLLHAGRVVSAERLMAVDLQVLNPGWRPADGGKVDGRGLR